MLRKYATVALQIGLNLQKNQILFVKAPIDAKEFVEEVVDVAFELGAYDVYVKWNDEVVTKHRLKKASIDALKEYPEWEIKASEYLLDKKGAVLSITGADPDALKDVPPDRIGIFTKTANLANKDIMKRMMTNEISWCVVAYPSKKWAKKVIGEEDTEKLLSYILKASRIEGNPIENWKKHIKQLNRITDFLNERQFDYLIYEGPGTDLQVGLPKDHVWISGSQKNSQGITFVPNIPTEEVFTAPHREKINGTVSNSLPLVYGGNIIDKFKLTFKDGEIIKYEAEVGKEILETILNTDKGAKRLGEVALVSVESPIYKMKTVFFNTLFDENAASHFAFGRAYPNCIKNGEKLSEKELLKAGINTSLTHVDFMIGNEEINVWGVKGNEKIKLMEKGLFVI
ncbi:peptidase M29 [Thermosipho melanesiensis]|uniref:Peptidase M29, aminopeptidase II n=2 Tax=Thermosipho melanesiensis TaxID=46541 RepID=A6LJC5_THEM4|nr:aminopeptidase [Thermosipho melanesiensis]ABR30026.1 peptidase M29, aminopeptidase II [Thermosipho melanesiensis BI429]APT73227.1 peptidase M29 [Thermosipho melanesiensis]OOC38620.1 peptidase M29 [Thermosipho melanesiensis]OOC40424.1 peptidase M29 [Thermosipho melanesiensis]OOC40689.1 peptidase M29 [Thermosipho melanesiensis]